MRHESGGEDPEWDLPVAQKTVTNGRARYEPAAAVSQQRHSQPSPHRQASPVQHVQPATQSHVQVSRRPQALSEQQAPAALAAEVFVVDDFARIACRSREHLPSAAQQAGFATEVAAVIADFAERSQHLHWHASPQRQGSPSQHRQPLTQAQVQFSHNPQALLEQQPWLAAAFAPVPETVITSPNPERAVSATKVRSLANMMEIPSPEAHAKRKSQAQNSAGERGMSSGRGAEIVRSCTQRCPDEDSFLPAAVEHHQSGWRRMVGVRDRRAADIANGRPGWQFRPSGDE